MNICLSRISGWGLFLKISERSLTDTYRRGNLKLFLSVLYMQAQRFTTRHTLVDAFKVG